MNMETYRHTTCPHFKVILKLKNICPWVSLVALFIIALAGPIEICLYLLTYFNKLEDINRPTGQFVRKTRHTRPFLKRSNIDCPVYEFEFVCREGWRGLSNMPAV
jgi:hypothetical protein